jgi:magnesium-transporting ATPase (P-type)
MAIPFTVAHAHTCSSWSFSQAIREQFRRIANVYFIVVGCIMAIGYYTDAFDSAISPWTTLGPLAVVISVSLVQEGSADYGRHKSDEATNNHPCVVLRRADDLDESAEPRIRDETLGNDVSVDLRKAYFVPDRSTQTPFASKTSESIRVAFEKLSRKDIRPGDLVLVRNRDMVPADIILLASSSEGGSAYIETSSIDGETNLKLRTSPHLPKNVLEIIRNERSNRQLTSDEGPIKVETLEEATKRITRLSSLAYPDGKTVLDNPANPTSTDDQVMEKPRQQAFLRRISVGDMLKAVRHNVSEAFSEGDNEQDTESIIKNQEKYVAALKSESPNPSVNTSSGVLVLPPVELDGPGVDLPLNADNILLRGAVLRNTEWVIGLVCFTGMDTKLVQNSVDTPSKFSQLDKLMNWAVLLIIGLMVIIIAILATLNNVIVNTQFDDLW